MLPIQLRTFAANSKLKQHGKLGYYKSIRIAEGHV